MRVAITGGTGYVGPAVVKAIIDHGHEAVVLEHHRRIGLDNHERLARVHGDVLDATSLRRAFNGCDAVVHLVAIRREHPGKGMTFDRMHVQATRNVVEAAKEEGIRRFILMSANNVDSANTGYFRTKLAMEGMVKEAGFDWTIFRPSFISSDQKGGFDDEFSEIVDKVPVLPSFAGGNFEIQPVARRDVAEAFASAIDRSESIGKTYVLAGPERMTWNDYLRRLARLRGKKRALAPVPRWFILPATSAMGPLAPASPDELRMLMQGNVGDPAPAVHDLGLELHPWEEAVQGLARRR